jgi:hypothetical protein
MSYHFLIKTTIPAVPLICLTLVLFIYLQGIYSDEEKHLVYAGAIPGDFNFGAGGDWGCNSNTNNTVSNIAGKHTQLVLALGDYSYQTSANCWFKIVHPIEKNLKIVIGNHEYLIYPSINQTTKLRVLHTYKSPFLLNEYMNHFGLKKQYYSFNYHNVHFVMMSTETGFVKGSDQYNFVQNDLADASTNSTIKWIVVCFHHPLYTSPGQILPGSVFRDIYHPIFDRYGVDLVLEAHNHNYQRSYPLEYNPSSPFNPLITTKEYNNYTNPIGQIYIIVGTGGESPFGLTGQSPFIVAQYTQLYGFLKLDVVNGGLTMLGTFYTNDGMINDHFSIEKCAVSPHPSTSLLFHYQSNLPPCRSQ